MLFSEIVVREFKGLVDNWVTFNEPAVFSALTYAAGIWPPGGKQNNFAFIKAFGIKGAFKRAMENMEASHKSIYSMIKKLLLFQRLL